MKFQTELKNSKIEAVQIFHQSPEFQNLLNDYGVEWLLGTIEACKKMCKEKYHDQNFDFLEDDVVLENVSSTIETEAELNALPL